MGPHRSHCPGAATPAVQGQDGWIWGHLLEEQEVFETDHPNSVDHPGPDPSLSELRPSLAHRQPTSRSEEVKKSPNPNKKVFKLDWQDLPWEEGDNYK